MADVQDLGMKMEFGWQMLEQSPRFSSQQFMTSTEGEKQDLKNKAIKYIKMNI